MENRVFDLLVSAGIVDAGQVQPYYPRVRDREDVGALRCLKSGVVFLSRTDHISIADYESKPAEVALQVGCDTVPYSSYPELGDTERRARDFGDLIRGKRWLDVGTGRGLILRVLGPQASEAVGVEPSKALRDYAIATGLTVHGSAEDVTGQFDCITLFSVFEHLLDPIEMLNTLRKLLAPNGQIILEVPHANDFLLTTLDCEAFRAFTLWSEHLVLHTRESLAALARLGGFSTPVVRGYQRYPISNHLHWLRHGKPGGHERWGFINSDELHTQYTAALQSIDQTDTLIAYLKN